MLDTMTPNTYVSLYTYAKPLTDTTGSGGGVAALAPLMVKFSRFRVGLLGDYILALWFAQLEIPADTMNHNPALLALYNITTEP